MPVNYDMRLNYVHTYPLPIVWTSGHINVLMTLTISNVLNVCYMLLNYMYYFSDYIVWVKLVRVANTQVISFF